MRSAFLANGIKGRNKMSSKTSSFLLFSINSKHIAPNNFHNGSYLLRYLQVHLRRHPPPSGSLPRGNHPHSHSLNNQALKHHASDMPTRHSALATSPALDSLSLESALGASFIFSHVHIPAVHPTNLLDFFPSLPFPLYSAESAETSSSTSC